METWRNITFGLLGHNRPIGRRAAQRATGPGFLLIFPLVLAGCAVAPPGPSESSHWDSTPAVPVGLLSLARARVDPDLHLPADAVYPLSAEYALLVARRPAEWAELCRRLNLPRSLAGLDLSRGPVIGILAHLGQSADDHWPVRLVSIRVADEQGLLTVAVKPGLYHPVQTAGYLELAQLRGPAFVNAVRINSRTFVLRSTSRPH